MPLPVNNFFKGLRLLGAKFAFCAPSSSSPLNALCLCRLLHLFEFDSDSFSCVVVVVSRISEGGTSSPSLRRSRRYASKLSPGTFFSAKIISFSSLVVCVWSSRIWSFFSSQKSLFWSSFPFPLTTKLRTANAPLFFRLQSNASMCKYISSLQLKSFVYLTGTNFMCSFIVSSHSSFSKSSLASAKAEDIMIFGRGWIFCLVRSKRRLEECPSFLPQIQIYALLLRA